PVSNGGGKRLPPREGAEEPDERWYVVGMVLASKEARSGGSGVDRLALQGKARLAVATRHSDCGQERLVVALATGIGEAIKVEHSDLLCLGIAPFPGGIGARRVNDTDGPQLAARLTTSRRMKTLT